MPVLTASAAHRLDVEASTRSVPEIAAYLQDMVGQRMAAAIAGLTDVKQIGRYASKHGPEPRSTMERRLREGYKVVHMLSDACDDKTARAWLFGMNSHLDDRAPIEVLGTAVDTTDFTMVVQAAQRVASAQT